MFKLAGRQSGGTRNNKKSPRRRFQPVSLLGPNFKSFDRQFVDRLTLTSLFSSASDLVGRFGAWLANFIRQPLGGKKGDLAELRADAFRPGFGKFLEPLEVRAMMTAVTPGDLVVYRVGDGTAALSSAATAVFLDEYTPAGALVQSISVPSTGGAGELTATGNSTTEGFLSRSADGQSLVIPGYQAAAGATSPAAATSAVDPREVATLSTSGAVSIAATTSAFSAGNIRSAVMDGSNIWMDGSAAGVVATTVGANGTAGTVVSTTVTNLRVAEIYNGQLYYSTGSGSTRGVYAAGIGEPTGTGVTATSAQVDPVPTAASSSPYGFFFARVGTGATVNGYDKHCTWPTIPPTPSKSSRGTARPGRRMARLRHRWYAD